MSRYAAGRNSAGSKAPSSTRFTSRSSAWSSSRNRSTRPLTATRSPRSKRPAWKSASRKMRAGSVPVRSRSSSARYVLPLRAVIRSLRVQAKTPSMGPPSLKRAMGTRSSAIVATASILRTGSDNRVYRVILPGSVRHMDHVDWRERPELRDPALICAFKGWNDAGEAASAALGFLIESFEAREVARIDPEEFYDFTAVRPTVRMSEGRSRTIDWPANTLHAATIPGTDHDLLMFQGVEPSLKWGTFTKTVVDMAQQLGATTIVTLGALLADVPHTRDIPMTGICSDADMVERLGFQQSTY